MKNLVLILFLVMFHVATSQSFLHRDGQNIVDKDGNNILLRGLGLGGWMVQEGYMLQTGAFAGPQHIIKEKIIDSILEFLDGENLADDLTLVLVKT